MHQLLTVLASILTLSSLDTLTMKTASIMPNLPGVYLLAQKLNCNNSQTQIEINECARLSYQNTDKKLNQVYQQLLPKLQGSRQQKLIAAQQAWIKFRDSSCQFETSRYEGGSIAPTIYLACLEKITKQRTQQLQEYLKPDS
jgi:uncharacterized protein YecT (DUF1311 family)